MAGVVEFPTMSVTSKNYGAAWTWSPLQTRAVADPQLGGKGPNLEDV